jgi:hypothetical protein
LRAAANQARLYLHLLQLKIALRYPLPISNCRPRQLKPN